MFGNNVLASVFETNGPVGLKFGMVVYYHEWIIFCSGSVHQKGQGHRSRSHDTLENHVLTSVSVIYVTIGRDFDIVVCTHV